MNVTWNGVSEAGGYNVYRTANGTSYTLVGSPIATPSFTDTTAAPDTAYLYVVRSMAGSESGDSNADLATTIPLTDDPPVSGVTGVKSAHFEELLTAVNAVRALAGLSAIAFTQPAPAPSVLIRRQHVLDLRSGLDAAREALALSAMSYTDPALVSGATRIKAAHVVDLRNGVR